VTFKQLKMNPVEMKIGILQAGHCPDDLYARHGDYDGFYKRLLDGNGFEFETWPVLDGAFPTDVNDADGWIVTGSKFGAYEDHDWIRLLEDFLRDAFAAAVPIVGICFGHQILAQALGGKVEKFSGGWSVGVENYAFDGFADDVRMIAWHQDQVTELPQGASVVGSSGFCRYAALAYDDRAYTIQAHPEFEADFVSELIEARRNLLPEDIATRGINSLAIETSSTKIAEGIVEFFKRERTPD
jgi:GMP synthase (glutamine-hydrolysing)